MAIYECTVCGYMFDENKEAKKWSDLAENWYCPVCDSVKKYFKQIKGDNGNEIVKSENILIVKDDKNDDAQLIDNELENYLSEWQKESDEFEAAMGDIHRISKSGESIVEPMRTRQNVISWDDILIKGAQLAKIPLNNDEPVNTTTIIGPKAKQPLVIETPIYITHMSFGALSREAKIALAKGSAAVKTAMCSGEGGILKDSMSSSYKYIFEYVPNKYSVTDENLKQVDAIEIKIGQSAKPGVGGHLPGNKVTSEIAEVRGFPEGNDIHSPAHFNDIENKDDLGNLVQQLREKSGGKPIGIKIAGGNVEQDMEIAVYAKPDFITIDGRAGSTAAAPKFIKQATSVPSIFVLNRARKFLNKKGIKDISLIITGGFRVLPDFAKAIALGADAVAIGSAALIACGCQQYRICNTGNCPVGITTQNPKLRARFNIELSAKRLENFLQVSTIELKNFARLTGNNDIHKLVINDLCTTNSEISNHTKIEHV